MQNFHVKQKRQQQIEILWLIIIHALFTIFHVIYSLSRVTLILLITSLEVPLMLQKIILIELSQILKFRSKNIFSHSLPNKFK